MGHQYEILVSEPYETWAVNRLREIGAVIELADSKEETIAKAVVSADALLVRTFSQITETVIKAATRLKVIGRAGVGLENIDLEACSRKRIVVVSTPDASTDAVADLTLGMMLSLVRRINEGDRAARTGQFHAARRGAAERELHELTVGILGMGRIGKAVARRCRNGFGMRIIYHDVVSPGWLDFAAQFVPLGELYAQSDVLTLHVPLTDLTRGMVNSSVLRQMKKGALFINTCRGGVVDNVALAGSLASGQLSGAGLDVTDPEPLPSDHPLLAAPHTLITPHIGAKTMLAYRRMHDVVDDVIRVLQGQKPINPCPLGD